MSRQDTIGWLGELLVRAVLDRDRSIRVVHNSMPDADDPTIGISLHGQQIRIPLPDFEVKVPGGTLLTKQRAPKSYYIEVKTKSYFGFFQQWNAVTTGFDNWNLELYQQLSEEHGYEVKIWFVQIFNRCQFGKQSLIHQHAIAGIYMANISDLYYSRPPYRFNDLACWPVCGGPLSLINARSELGKAEDTRDLVSQLLNIALRDATIPPDPASRA